MFTLNRVIKLATIATALLLIPRRSSDKSMLINAKAQTNDTVKPDNSKLDRSESSDAM